MYEIYLTAGNEGAHPTEVARLLTVEDKNAAAGACVALQPYLRDGIEAHFVSTD